MRSHGAVASKELGKAVVRAVWEDWRSAPVTPRVRAMLAYLEKMSLEPERLGPEDVVPLREAGLSESAIEDAIYVCAAFHIIIRIADALEFHVPSEDDLDRAADQMLERGYRTGGPP